MRKLLFIGAAVLAFLGIGTLTASACNYVPNAFISTAFASQAYCQPAFTGAFLPAYAPQTVIQAAAPMPCVQQQVASPAYAAQPVQASAVVQQQAAVVQQPVCAQAVLAAQPVVTASVVATPVVSPVYAVSTPLFFSAHQHFAHHGAFGNGLFRSGVAFPGHRQVIQTTRSRTVIR